MKTRKYLVNRSKYRQVSVKKGSLLLQVVKGSIRLCYSSSRPSPNNDAYHHIETMSDGPVQMQADEHLWAMSNVEESVVMVSQKKSALTGAATKVASFLWW